MVKSTYGSPNANDATSRYDKIVNRSSAYFMHLLAEVSPKVMNRPGGSKVESPKQQKETFQAMYYENPQTMAQALQEHIGMSPNPITGARRWSDWVIKQYEEMG